MSPPPSIYSRYHDLQRYVSWTDADQQRIVSSAAVATPHFAALVDDFYQEIQRHPAANSVITGGQVQIDRLKKTLLNWLGELFAGTYDASYVERRWRVGLKHVEIDLPQVYTAAALSRLRIGLMRVLSQHWPGDETELSLVLQSLNKLLDLDLAVIGDAYETEYVARQQAIERRRLRDVLHQEQELSAGLLAHAQAVILILDRQGQIVRCNSYFERLGAWQTDEVLDRDWFDLCINPDDRPRMRQELLAGESRESPSTAASVFCLAGQTRHLHWSAVPLNDASGQPFAILVIGHDITVLQEAQQRALQAERLAAIGQMATGLAHESRNALQRIGASAETLELELEGNPLALALVARIQQSQTHLHKLLDEVRSYAAPAVLDRSPCRLSEVWREAWELLLAQRRGRQAELREHLEVRDLAIECDRFRLVQVFRNLLDNALAACSDPVRIDICCEQARVEQTPGIRVTISDNGPGLNAEQRRRIFEPFYTTKPTGTGLGMAIAQRIVEAHGGTIAVGQESAAGTEIVITLPTGSHLA
jgi:PAS domain S-box-containing protein